MTMPKRKRRSIVVDGSRYHWAVDGGLNDAYVRIQEASGKGGVLSIQFVGYVKPKHIEIAIRTALNNGWKSRKNHFMELGGTDLEEPVTFEIKPDGADRWWFFDRYQLRFIPAGTKPLPSTGKITFLEKPPFEIQDVKVEVEGHAFGPDLSVAFTASIPEIDQWLDSCPETQGVPPENDGRQRIYRLPATGDFSFAEIRVDNVSGQIRCKSNLTSRRVLKP